MSSSHPPAAGARMSENIAIFTLVTMSTVTTLFLVHWCRSTVVAIRRRVHHLCVFCGYSRNGNRSGICPECGCPTPRSV